MNKIKKKRKAFVQQSDCVACQIMNGIMAEVDMTKCVGCGKCAKECPASVIIIREVEA